MSDPFSGVTLQVISDGSPLEFYDDPDEDPNNPSPTTRQQYAEAVTGAIFKLRIVLSPRFSLYFLGPNDAVRISVKYDAQSLAWYRDLTAAHIRDCRSKGRPADTTFTALTRYCSDSQQWIRGDLTFGALTTNDTAPSLAKGNDLGTIRVTVHPVHRTKRYSPLHTAKDRSEKPIVEVSEKTLKGKAITNTVRTANDVPSVGPAPTTYYVTPGGGAVNLQHSIPFERCSPNARMHSPNPISRARDGQRCHQSRAKNPRAAIPASTSRRRRKRQS